MLILEEEVFHPERTGSPERNLFYLRLGGNQKGEKRIFLFRADLYSRKGPSASENGFKNKKNRPPCLAGASTAIPLTQGNVKGGGELPLGGSRRRQPYSQGNRIFSNRKKRKREEGCILVEDDQKREAPSRLGKEV